MAQKGWISVRNVPIVNPADQVSESKIYFNRLEAFFTKYRLCPKCQGWGRFISYKRPQKNTVLKFRGIPELERLHQSSFLVLGDIIRDILYMEIEGMSICNRCNGFRFVLRKDKNACDDIHPSLGDLEDGCSPQDRTQTDSEGAARAYC